MIKKFFTYLTGFITLGWSFYSLYSIFSVAGGIFSNPDNTYSIMSVKNPDVTHVALGLFYHGYAGIALLITELLLVGLAIVFACSSKNLPKRAALLILFAWSLLWFGNCLRMEMLDNWKHPALTIPTAIITLCALIFMILRWKKIQPKGK